MPTSSPFYDPNLATISSAYFNSIEDVLDPSSPDFDPNAYLILSISPNTNLDTATNGFTTSGGSGAADSQFVAPAIPESSSLALLIGGLRTCACTGMAGPCRGRSSDQPGSSGGKHSYISKLEAAMKNFFGLLFFGLALLASSTAAT